MVKKFIEALRITLKQIVIAVLLALLGVCLINRYSNYLEGRFGTVLFYGIYLTLLVYSLAFNKILFKQFIKPSRYMFSLYTSVSFSFVIISIIFGFHTDLLVKYDTPKYDNSYYWINPINILKFPIEQSSRNEKQPFARINLNDDSAVSIINIFVIDNTASVQNDVSANNYVLLKINSQNLVPISSSSIENSNQLIVPLLLSVVFQNDLSKNNDVLFYRYNGRFNSVHSLHSLIGIQNGDVIKKAYYQSNKVFVNKSLIDSLKPTKQVDTTDLNNFFDISGIINHDIIKKYTCVKVYFVSDYQDEKGSKTIYSNLDTLFAAGNVRAVSFIRTRGIRDRNDSYNDVIKQGHQLEGDNPITINKLDFVNSDHVALDRQLESVCSNVHQNHNVDSTLAFSYPYKSPSGNLCLESEMNINTEDDNLIFCLRNLDNYNDGSYFSFEVNGDKNLPAQKVNEPFSAQQKISSKDVIRISFSNYNFYENSRLRLDIYSKKYNSVTGRRCEVLPVVPITSVNLLIMFYSVLIFSLSMMFIYSQFSVIYLIRKSAILSNSSLFSSTLIPVLLLSLYIIPIFYVLYWYWKIYGICSLVILLLIFLITIPHYLLFLNSQLERWKTTKYKLLMIS
jgi:hypothetical protein